MQKILKFLFSPAFMGALLMIFAVTMAAATFIGNDYGSSAAYDFVYGTKWFGLILLLLSVNLTGQMIIFKLYRKTKITIMVFHLAFVLMIAGAAITHYTGWEGSIHIREGEEQNRCLSNEKYIGYAVKDKNGEILDQSYEEYPMTSSSAGNYSKKLRINGRGYKLNLSGIQQNVAEIVTDDPYGVPMISLLCIDEMSRKSVNLKNGEIKTVNGNTVGFESPDETDIKITIDSGMFFIEAKNPFSQINMMSKETNLVGAGQKVGLKTMQIVALNDSLKIVPQSMALKGTIKLVSVSPEMQETGRYAFVFSLLSGSDTAATIRLLNSKTDGEARVSEEIDGKLFEVSYGSVETSLPFSLKLNDFVLERYPGSNSPSGYKSDVLLSDKTAGVEKPFVVFMNNILKYKGYRFYQSSYDPDEKGTILSVNRDPAGIAVTYTGYGFLFVFIILSLLNKNSFFNKVSAGNWSSAIRKTLPLIIVLILLSGTGGASAQKLIADREAAEELGKVLVQDQKGRTKPLFTLSNDILRKVTRENKFEGLTSMQVFLGINFDFDNWKEVPLIKVSNKELQKNLGLKGNMAAFADLFDLRDDASDYRLSELVDKVYLKSPDTRTKLDKEILKVDERVNIVYMIYTGSVLKLFPLSNGTDWGSPQEAIKTAMNQKDSVYLGTVIQLYGKALRESNFAAAKQASESISKYQKMFAKYDLPSEFKTRAELLYYRLMIFEKLFPFYFTVGLIMIFAIIVMVIRGKGNTSLIVKILGWMLFAGFLFHTFGLALRWYIAGHSPMSNGYESMLFISWVTLLAGLIFSCKSKLALSATAVLAGGTLMVAHLSFMDPEITNLVPVLKSYWLTLHVSVITGSYGFLGLGAILGLIVMILLALSNDRNRQRVSDTIDELTVINYKTLSLGLYFLTTGTFLGAVWANESWGRYWGWDPKETWSLITIVIYSLTIHSRLIPGMKDVFTFNMLSLFAFSSVLMTYFGVNYYLSGLHSYAGGSAASVPGIVYVAVIVLVLLSVAGYRKYMKWERVNNM